jgi:hypothetical protein
VSNDNDGMLELANVLRALGFVNTPNEAASVLLGMWVGLRVAAIASEEAIGRLLTACAAPEAVTAAEGVMPLLNGAVVVIAGIGEHLGEHEHST